MKQINQLLIVTLILIGIQTQSIHSQTDTIPNHLEGIIYDLGKGNFKHDHISYTEEHLIKILKKMPEAAYEYQLGRVERRKAYNNLRGGIFYLSLGTITGVSISLKGECDDTGKGIFYFGCAAEDGFDFFLRGVTLLSGILGIKSIISQFFERKKATKTINHAIDIYNNKTLQLNQEETTLNLNLNSNGLGLSYNF